MTRTERYRYQELTMPLRDGLWIQHDGTINDDGQVASSVLTHGLWRPFVWQGGRSRVLDGLAGGSEALAVMVNHDREAVGTAILGDGTSRAVLWDGGGQVHDLGTLPGYTDSTARAINAQGQVVGYAFNKPHGLSSLLLRPAHAFLWAAGHMHDLGTLPGCPSSRAYAINDQGQVAGWVLTADDRTHAMVWERGMMRDIGTFPDGRLSVATAINDAGQVVGSASHDNGLVSAFLWQRGVMQDLGLLAGDTYSKALGINNRGDVVGVSRPNSDITGSGGRPFLWDADHGMRDLMGMAAVRAGLRNDLAHSCMTFSVNDQDQVLGLRFQSHPDRRLMFLLTPLGTRW